MEQKRALSAVDVAGILHVSKNTVYELIRRGEINSYKVGRKIRFTQEDVDDYIARSRHEKQLPPVSSVSVQSSLLNGVPPQGREFILSGQDVILDILSNYLRQYGYQALRAYVGSFESLLSLYQDNVQAATSHLWDGDSEDYNIPYVRRLMPGTHAVIINLSYRMQGFYVQSGNPKQIYDWKDLTKENVKFLNRRKGSGSRILLDEKLMKLKINPGDIRGYADEIGSHLTLANAVARGEADVGLGTERVTRQVDHLEFVPLQEERYDLILKKEMMEYSEVRTMIRILNSREFRAELAGISGNDYRDLGKIMAEV
ncbi:MAG: helix-turn-helix transcriptional regulator [Lachnospiraceae bacterium]|nr:helix-turn-helix transcriptional regulator [Lachnospiraceae bacterium]